MISPSCIPPQRVSVCAGKVGEDRRNSLPRAFSPHLSLRTSVVIWFYSPDVFVEDCGSGYFFPQLPAASSSDKETSLRPEREVLPRHFCTWAALVLRIEPSLIPCCVFLDFSIIFSVCGLDLWFGKIPWRRAWQPTPVLLPGKSHGQRSLVGYSPWGRKEWDMTEHGFSIQWIKCLESAAGEVWLGPKKT